MNVTHTLKLLCGGTTTQRREALLEVEQRWEANLRRQLVSAARILMPEDLIGLCQTLTDSESTVLVSLLADLASHSVESVRDSALQALELNRSRARQGAIGTLLEQDQPQQLIAACHMLAGSVIESIALFGAGYCIILMPAFARQRWMRFGGDMKMD